MATRNFVPRANNEGGIGTSVKQWASGFFQKLAVGAITTAVTVLTPAADANNQQPATTGWVRSQFQSILKTVLSAAGLKYNIAQNGYICFGALFGGLILQWGYTKSNTYFSFPVNFKKCRNILFTPRGVEKNEIMLIAIELKGYESDLTGSGSILFETAEGTPFAGYVYYFVIGY